MNSVPVDSTSVLQIADHVLIRRIGKGGYGEVWLAKNVIGGFRAVKVIYRKKFTEERPSQREFEGICKFEPISRSHPGLVTILQVGQNEQAGYFYYVMELADDARTGQTIETDTYVPRTLKEEMANHQRIPLDTRLQIARSLTSALGHLHAQALIHRDIKPSNIIFVNGKPKFADIGLIANIGENVSAVGSIGYMPPEGPGEMTGDIFSLGKVFYELFMGLPCKSFPELPDEAEEFTTVPALLQVNNLILKACHSDPRRRFQTANELHRALLAVSETVQEIRPGIGTTGAGDSAPSMPDIGTGTKLESRVGAGETTGAPMEGQPVASGEQRPRASWTRRAALFLGVPTAVGGAFLLGRSSVTPDDPSDEEKLRKWYVLYDTLDDKLACFMGYVGTFSPNTKFLIYSRGTDKNWIKQGFQPKWVNEIEDRFPELKGRINTMVIRTPPGQDHESFYHPETAEEMKQGIKLILGLPDRNPTPTPPDSPVIVLMDTTAVRGVYDNKHKNTKITNAEVLQKQLQNLSNKIYPVTISIESMNRGWHGEKRVLAVNPSLVIIHRSAFFHTVNADLELGYPRFDPQGRLIGWQP